MTRREFWFNIAFFFFLGGIIFGWLGLIIGGVLALTYCLGYSGGYARRQAEVDQDEADGKRKYWENM